MHAFVAGYLNYNMTKISSLQVTNFSGNSCKTETIITQNYGIMKAIIARLAHVEFPVFSNSRLGPSVFSALV